MDTNYIKIVIFIQFLLYGILFHPQSKLRIAKYLLNPVEVLEDRIREFSKGISVKWSAILLGILILIFTFVGIVASQSFMNEAIAEVPVIGIFFSIFVYKESVLTDDMHIVNIGYTAFAGVVILLSSRLIVQYFFRKIKYITPAILAFIMVIVSMIVGNCFKLIHLEEGFEIVLSCNYVIPKIIFTVFLWWISFIFVIEYYEEFMILIMLVRAYYEMMIQYGMKLAEESSTPYACSYPVDPFDDVWVAISDFPGCVKILLCIVMITIGIVCKELLKRFCIWFAPMLAMLLSKTCLGNLIRIFSCVICGFLVILFTLGILFSSCALRGYGYTNSPEIYLITIVLYILEYWLIRGYKCYGESDAEHEDMEVFSS